jgi:hypothetical protein
LSCVEKSEIVLAVGHVWCQNVATLGIEKKKVADPYYRG